MQTYADSHLFLAFRAPPLDFGPKMKQTTNAFIAEWARPLNQLLLRRRLPLRPPPQALPLRPSLSGPPPRAKKPTYKTVQVVLLIYSANAS